MPGARDVGVEVHSMSKAFDMIGWRIGWVCGHERIVRAFADVKDNFDSGQFIAIQKAAAAALDDPEIPKRTRAKYQPPAGKARRHAPAAAASSARCPAARTSSTRRRRKAFANGGPGGGRIDFENAEAASQYLITEQSICTVPWDDAGPFLRFSVTYEAADEAGRRRPHGRNRIAAQEHSAGVLTYVRFSSLTSFRRLRRTLECAIIYEGARQSHAVIDIIWDLPDDPDGNVQHIAEHGLIAS